jgi:hypothetical protein
MDAIAAEADGEIGPVVEDHRHAPRLGDRHEHIDRRSDDVVRSVLQPDLQRRHIARVQGMGEGAAELRQVVEPGRRDQVEAAEGFGHVAVLGHRSSALKP